MGLVRHELGVDEESGGQKARCQRDGPVINGLAILSPRKVAGRVLGFAITEFHFRKAICNDMTNSVTLEHRAF
jgi:hypothetical protein